MRHLTPIVASALMLLAVACGTVKYVPIKTTEYVTVRDTTVLHLRDTLVKVPEIRYKDFTGLLDTLFIRTKISEFRAYCDTTAGVLRGDVTQSGKIPVQIVERERIVYRDSIRDREVPVPVEVTKEVRYVPWIVKVLAWLGGIGLLLGVGWLLRKFGIL